MKNRSIFLIILKILASMAAGFYILFLIDEGVPLAIAKFADFSVYLLFLVFCTGYIFLFRNLIISGLILVIWYGLQWLLVFSVWQDGELTLILGLPIGILGLMILITGIIQQNRNESPPDHQGS